MTQDLPYIFYWWTILFLLGILVFPLTKRLFAKFFDFGYPFAKILGILLVSYLVWVLGSLKILPFFRETVGLVIIILALVNFLILIKNKKDKEIKTTIVGQIYGCFFKKRPIKIFIFEEILFFLALLFWCFVRAHEPSIHGLEKFMDFGFINSILRSNFFPPDDMWLAPSPDPRYTGSFTINYYYFGHLTAAVLTKLTGIDSAISYNLVLATLFGLCFSGAFSIGANLFYLFLYPLVPPSEESSPSARPPSEEGLRKKPKRRGEPTKFSLFAISERLKATFKTSKASSRAVSELENFRRRPQRLTPLILAGLLTAFLVTLSGNLHPLYVFKDPNRYWYPDATRFIPLTIHEFPIYSWVVADLHGHVFDIPFVLLAIATLISLLTSHFSLLTSAFLGLTLAVLYMTNAWDGIIYLCLSGLVFLSSHMYLKTHPYQPPKYQKSKIKNQKYNLKFKKILRFFNLKFLSVILHFAFLILIFFLFSLPFNLSFTPFVKGIGVNCPPDFTPEKWGPFIFEKQNCQRSPLYMLAILWGFFYFNAVGFVVFLPRPREVGPRSARSDLVKKNLSSQDVFVLLMIILSTFLLIFPEFFYAKDIYPAHFRANTMFKLGYQAFIMMSIASGYIIVRLLKNIKNQKSKIKIAYQNGKILNFKLSFCILHFAFLILLIPQLFLVSIYPIYAINSYYGNLKVYHGLDGAAWLKNQYPDDYQAILWLKNLEPRPYNLEPVIAEAVGESYTDYARVSAYTGLPTIIGWPVHEWLWRGSYDEAGARVPEVQTIYEDKDLEKTRQMLKKYNVSYVFVGALEREKYKNLNEGKFEKLGTVVFESGGTKIFKISSD